MWWLFISFTFYNSTVFRVVLIFVECTLTLEGGRKIKSEFPDESKQSPQSSTFCSLSINGVKPLSNDFHIVYWIFSPQKTKCLPAGVIVILEVIKKKHDWDVGWGGNLYLWHKLSRQGSSGHWKKCVWTPLFRFPYKDCKFLPSGPLQFFSNFQSMKRFVANSENQAWLKLSS